MRFFGSGAEGNDKECDGHQFQPRTGPVMIYFIRLSCLAAIKNDSNTHNSCAQIVVPRLSLKIASIRLGLGRSESPVGVLYDLINENISCTIFHAGMERLVAGRVRLLASVS